jgi:predicted nucleotidyltransferase
MQKRSTPFVKVRYAPSKEKIDQFLAKYAEELKKSIPLLLMVAFGSYFNDRYSWGSDLDILLVINEKKMAKKTAYNLASVRGAPVMLDILMYTKKEYKQMLARKNPFLRAALRDGKILIDNL